MSMTACLRVDQVSGADDVLAGLWNGIAARRNQLRKPFWRVKMTENFNFSHDSLFRFVSPDIHCPWWADLSMSSHLRRLLSQLAKACWESTSSTNTRRTMASNPASGAMLDLTAFCFAFSLISGRRRTWNVYILDERAFNDVTRKTSPEGQWREKSYKFWLYEG